MGLASQDPITIEQTNRWHSVCYPLFNSFRDMFYDKKGKRHLHIDSLSLLQDVALAIWYGDCGKVENDKVILNTHIWKEKGTKTTVKYFSYLDYKATIFKERNNFRLRLDEKSSEDFLKMITPHLPLANPFHTPNQEQ